MWFYTTKQQIQVVDTPVLEDWLMQVEIGLRAWWRLTDVPTV